MLPVWLWLFAALSGLVFALVARQNAVDELRLLGEIANGRRRLGRGHVRDETVVAVIDAVWLAIGLWYLSSGIQTSTPAVGYILSGTSFLLSFSTLARWLDRRYAARPHDDADDAERDFAEDAWMGEHRRDLERQHTEEA